MYDESKTDFEDLKSMASKLLALLDTLGTNRPKRYRALEMAMLTPLPRHRLDKKSLPEGDRILVSAEQRTNGHRRARPALW